MAKNKRKYGDAWKDIEIDEASNDAVFDKFLRQPPPVASATLQALPQSVSLPLQAPPKDALSNSVSLPLGEIKPYTTDAPPQSVSLPLSVSPAWDKVTPFKGYTRLYNAIVDDLLPQLTTSEQAVYVHLFRLSYGFNNTTCLISLPTLAKRTHLHVNGVQKILKQLRAKGLIERLETVLGKGREQGVEYSLPIPPSMTQGVSLPLSVSNKDNKDLKTIKKGLPSALDATSCPDCHGTGFLMKRAGDKSGVVKCKHEALKKSPA